MLRAARILPLALAAGLAAGLGAGCDPTCRQSCKKVLSCSDELDIDGQRLADCEDYCLRQQQLYDDTWDDPDLSEAFHAMKRCIRDATCDELAAGECHDDDLYLW